MAVKSTSLTFSATNQSLWAPGFATGFRIDSGNALMFDPEAITYDIDIGALGFGVSAQFYVDFKIGLLAYAELANAGSFETKFNLNVDVVLPGAIKTGLGQPQHMSLDFTRYSVVSAEISSTAFEGAPRAGLDLIIGLEAGLRNGQYYHWFGDGDFDDFKLIDVDLAIPLISVDLLTPMFSFELTDGVTLTGQLPTGADTSGRSINSSIVTAHGASDTRFLELEADLDALLVKLLEKIPGVGAVVRGISEVVFAEHVFDIHDYLSFIPANKFKLSATVLDVGAGAGAVITEDVKVDIAGTDGIPNVGIRLVSDNGTPTNFADDRIVNGQLGQILNIDTSTLTGVGHVKVKAYYDLNNVTFSHAVGLGINASFTIDALMAELSGAWVPPALAFSIGPLFHAEFPEGGFNIDLFDFYKDSFQMPTGYFDAGGTYHAGVFNQQTATYEVFYADVNNAPPGWIPEAPNAEQAVYEFRNLLVANLNATISAVGELWNNSPTQNVQSVQAGHNQPNPGTTNASRIWQGNVNASQSLFEGGNNNFVIVSPAVAGSNLKVNVGLNFVIGGPRLLAAEAGFAATDADKLTLLNYLDAQAPNTLIFEYGAFELETTNPVEIIGQNKGDLLVFIDGAQYFDGGGQTAGEHDVFMGSFRQSDPGIAITWDLNAAVTGNVGVDLANGITVRNVEAFWLVTGNADDNIRTHINQDYVRTSGGKDLVTNTADYASDTIDLGDGDDVVINNAPVAAANYTDTISGGKGYDIAVHSQAAAMRLDFTFNGAAAAGGDGLGADASILSLTQLVLAYAQDVLGGSNVTQLERNGTGNDAGDALVIINGTAANGKTVYASSIEGVSVIGSATANDLVMFSGGIFYDGGASAGDTLVGDFATFETLLNAANGLNLAAGTATSTFGVAAIKGFERLIVFGTTQTDRLTGGTMSDLLGGEGGSDVLYGGNDKLLDVLAGGGNDDFFTWSNNGADVILGDDGFRSSGAGEDSLVIGADGLETRGLAYDFYTNAGQLDGTGRTDRGSLAFYAATGTFAEILQALDLAADTSKARAATFMGTANTDFMVYDDIEHTNVTGSTAFNDLIIYEDGAAYIGGESASDADVFAADFSAQHIGINLKLVDNDVNGPDTDTDGDGPDTDTDLPGQTLENGVYIQGIDRAVLRAGLGEDILTGASGNDYFHGGGGTDRLIGNGGNDELHGGDGNDFIYWMSDGNDVATGDAGDDRLIVGASGGALGVAINNFLTPVRAINPITDMIAMVGLAPAATSTTIFTNFATTRITFDSIESVDVVGSDGFNDFILYQGGLLVYGGEKSGGGDDDVFAANLAAETKDLYFNAKYTDNNGLYDFGLGGLVGGFERLIVKLGSGNDHVIGGAGIDWVDAGDGNDLLETGGSTEGTEAFLGGDGDDILVFNGGSAFLDGGAGYDAIQLENLTGGLGFTPLDSNFIEIPYAGLSGYADFADIYHNILPQMESVRFQYFDPVLNTQFVTLAGVEEIKATGHNGGNVFLAGTGTGIFIGGQGADMMFSREGNDLFVGGGTSISSPDSFIFAQNMGVDLVAQVTANQGIFYFIDHSINDLQFSALQNDLVIEGIGGWVTVVDYFAAGGNGLNLTFVTSDFFGTRDLSGLGAPGGGNTTPGQTVTGDAGNNELFGTAGNDTIFGKDGDDYLHGGAGSDVFDGGAGQDMVSYADQIDGVTVDLLFRQGYGGAANGDIFASIEHIVGGQNGNYLRGDNKDNTLVGADQADILEGRPGDDFLIGLSGDDQITGDQGDDMVFGDEGNDTLQGADGEDIVAGGDGVDEVSGGAGNDILDGGAGNDELFGDDGEDTLLYGGAEDETTPAIFEDGVDAFDGGNDIDTADFGKFRSAVQVDLNLTTDTAQTRDGEDLSTGTLRTIVSMTNVENVVGSNFADRLIGNAGDNGLDGGLGDDTLIGGAGTDFYIGGAGFDTIDFSGTETGPFGSIIVDLTGASPYGVIPPKILDSWNNSEHVESVEHFIGTNSGVADEFYLDGGGYTIDAMAGNDLVLGGDGNDVLNGGAGSDTLSGGLGNDTLSYAGSGISINIDLFSNFTSGGDADGDIISGFENLIGSDASDFLGGDGNANRIDGRGGVNAVRGNGGADTFVYSTGSLIVDDFDVADDKIDLSGLGAVFDFEDLQPYLETLVFPSGTQARINTIGDVALNWITAESLTAANFIFAPGAVAEDDHWYVSRGTTAVLQSLAVLDNDTGDGPLSVTAVGDPLNGTVSVDGSGTITFIATVSTASSSGEFSYTMTDGSDTETANVGISLVTTTSKNNNLTIATLGDEFSYIDGLAGNDTLTGGQGFDTLVGGIGKDRLYGKDGFDKLQGGEGNDLLDGGFGIDLAAGGIGDDTYVVDSTYDLVQELANQGFDIVKSTAHYTLSAEVEYLTLLGEANINGTGNSVANKLTGNLGDNTLNGLGGDDILVGYVGDDVLRGGAGEDNLQGGTGADDMDGGEDGDVYHATISDYIHDSGTVGRDKIIATRSWELTNESNVEDLTVAATVATNAYGNDLDNRIQGNDAVNKLRGYIGDDVLSAGGGNDELEGGVGRDNMTGGADADTFIFRTGDAGATTSTFDIINDFVTGVDRIDLQTIGTAGPQVLQLSQYAEVAISTNTYVSARSAALAEMADAQQRVVFVAGSADGWLFWNTDGNRTTIEESARLVGLNSVNAFAHGDLL
jgi:Ca2+-binding RTX toxin-like protein